MIVVEVLVKPKKPCKAMEKLIVPPPARVSVEFLLMSANENVGLNDSKNKVPGEQFTVTADVAFSVPVTCATVPKFMLATLRAHVLLTVTLTGKLVLTLDAHKFGQTNKRENAATETAAILTTCLSPGFIGR